jgi:small subunit ribosomal protein S9
MASEKTTKYYEAVGRRKTSIARVRLFEEKKTSFVINDKRTLDEHFPTDELRHVILNMLDKAALGTFKVTAHISGGGIHSQAEALRHGIARALVRMNESAKPALKKEGFLTRDARAKERRKFGLKKARKAPQWSKR